MRSFIKDYWAAILCPIILWLLVLSLAGCGGVSIDMTNNYNVTGDGNKISGTIRTDSRPDITTSTDATLDIPVSAIP